jgi:hypothetical protein
LWWSWQTPYLSGVAVQGVPIVLLSIGFSYIAYHLTRGALGDSASENAVVAVAGGVFLLTAITAFRDAMRRGLCIITNYRLILPFSTSWPIESSHYYRGSLDKVELKIRRNGFGDLKLVEQVETTSKRRRKRAGYTRTLINVRDAAEAERRLRSLALPPADSILMKSDDRSGGKEVQTDQFHLDEPTEITLWSGKPKFFLPQMTHTANPSGPISCNASHLTFLLLVGILLLMTAWMVQFAWRSPGILFLFLPGLAYGIVKVLQTLSYWIAEVTAQYTITTSGLSIIRPLALFKRKMAFDRNYFKILFRQDLRSGAGNISFFVDVGSIQGNRDVRTEALYNLRDARIVARILAGLGSSSYEGETLQTTQMPDQPASSPA